MSTKLVAGTATSGAVLSSDTSSILELQSGSTPTTAVTIDTAQNVGIGTSSPTQKLTVNGNQIISGGNSLYLAGSLNTNICAIKAPDNTGSVAIAPNGTEAMRIDSSGNLLVGTTSGGNGRIEVYGVPNSIPAIKTYQNASTSQQAIAFGNTNGVVGSISTSGSATAFNTSSDYRLKENVAPMTGALNTVAQLKPVTYNWKTDGSSSQGFIAHELQEVVPECVTGQKDAVDEEGKPVYQGIDTSFLVATLTASIQELKAIVDAQAERIAVLEAK